MDGSKFPTAQPGQYRGFSQWSWRPERQTFKDFKPSQSVQNLGVIFDSEVSFIQRIKNITKTPLSQASTEVLMHAFILCYLDYCNALLSGLPKKSISNLQLLQNSAARVLTRTRRQEHITPVLKLLHWLPVLFRIDFVVLGHLTYLTCFYPTGPADPEVLRHWPFD